MAGAAAKSSTNMGDFRPLNRRNPIVARIVRAWRELTTPAAQRRVQGSTKASKRGKADSGRTLVACSGGSDSSALVLALASATDELVVAHVVHDLRPRAEAIADRDAARDLAAHLGLRFVEARVSVKHAGGNAEAVARRERYAALVRLAKAERCGFIATAHHADDQLETMLMALMRGAGPRGLSGIAVSRAAGNGEPGIRIIRPMLGDQLGRVSATSHAEALELCRAAGWMWREDATNADTRLLRNALRHEVLPVLERLRPGAAARAARSAPTMRSAAAMVQGRAVRLFDRRIVGLFREYRMLAWPRTMLRDQDPAVAGSLLQLAYGNIVEGSAGGDQIGRRVLAPIVRAIRDESTESRAFDVRGVKVHVSNIAVELRLPR